MGEALAIEVRQEQGSAIVAAAGEIDVSTATRLRERLFEIAASGHPLVLDLDRVSFIDSVGLATLAGTAKRASAHGGSLQVACAQPKIRQLLRLTGLDCRIAVARTPGEALEGGAATSTATACGNRAFPRPGTSRTRSRLADDYGCRESRPWL